MIFQSNGAAEDQANLLSPVQRILFPWDLLEGELLSSGVGKITLEYADLSGFGIPLGLNGEVEEHVVDDDGNVGHVMFVEHLPYEFHGAQEATRVAGLAWYGKIQVDVSYRHNQAITDWVLSAEIAHEVDFFYLNPNGMRPALTKLAHPGGEDNHPWFGGDYWQQVGESWMAGLGIAYTDFVQPDPRFLHVFTAAMAPEIRRILNAERTDKQQPPVKPRPEIRRVKQPTASKFKIIGDNFDPAAVLLIDAKPTTAGEDEGRFVLKATLEPGQHSATVVNPGDQASTPFQFSVTARAPQA
jgi:hypothetical protein